MECRKGFHICASEPLLRCLGVNFGRSGACILFNFSKDCPISSWLMGASRGCSDMSFPTEDFLFKIGPLC